MSQVTDAVVELRKVSKSYGGHDGPVHTVLDAVDLLVPAGQSLAIIGPSGAGKSTLLNLIGGLDLPSAGMVLVEGRDLATLREDDCSRLRNRRIGFVFQDHHLLPQCTVLENILLPTLATGRASDERRRHALRLLERVALANRATDWPRNLSGGERQRVAVVRALIMQPALLLADEPTGALDHGTALGLADLLVALNREESVTVIVVTHQRDLAARMDRTLELLDGRFVERGAAGQG